MEPNAHRVRSDKVVVSRWYDAVDVLIVVSALVLLCVRAQDQPFSQTALSRLATVVALTEDGSWFIDRPPDERPNPFEIRTIDKVEVDGRLVSSKPPLLPWLMAWEYRAVKRLFGWSLDNLDDTKRILYAFTVTFCIVPWIAALAAAARLFRAAIPVSSGRVVALAALAFGTQASGFASTFNNHVPAAAALVICICIVRTIVEAGHRRLVAATLAGFLAGITATFDVPNAVYVAALGVVLLVRPREWNWLAFGLAAAVPIAIQSWLLFESTGSPLPVQVRPETYFYESAYWRNPVGVDALSEPKALYFLNMTVGNRGIFVLYPVLLAGVAAVAAAIVRPTACRLYILLAGLAFALVLAYYTASTNNYGGEVFGMRWLIPSMPVLILMGLPIWRRMENRLLLTVALAALAVSVYSAWESGSTPWTSGQEWTRHFFGE